MSAEAPPRPFSWQHGHLAVELPGAHVVFTTRRGGASSGPYASLNLGLLTDDDPGAVAENRRRLAAVLGVAPFHGRQVHGTRVSRVSVPPAEPPEADGQATAVPGLAPMVLAADCLPVAVATPGAVAMLHCGWRGLAGGVVAEGVTALRELAGDGAVHAAIGPGAGPCCYEVGDEVRAAFAAHGDAVVSGRHLDLKAVARRELEAAGAVAVHDAGLCTICGDPALWFSHRRDDGVTGRQAGVAWRA
jgi:purine-nucleoside/S-methyl-5'-thioadenosine phosphorylase / adenosine deaminase